MHLLATAQVGSVMEAFDAGCGISGLYEPPGMGKGWHGEGAVQGLHLVAALPTPAPPASYTLAFALHKGAATSAHFGGTS